MRGSAAAPISVLAGVVLAGCGGMIGGPGNVGVAWVRNESADPIEVNIDQQGRGFLGGTDRSSFGLPPWQDGWCYAFGEGIFAGSVTISVAGPSVPSPTAATIEVPDTRPADLTIVVDPAGAVTFSRATPPPDRYPCEGYPQLVPTVTP
jgi:hypothetical protein